MRTDDVVARIATMCPGFKRVDHALTSTFDEERDSPAAFVSLVSARPRTDRSQLLGASAQIVDETVGVFIQVRRTQDDALGRGANDDIEALRTQLHAALIGFLPAGVDEPLSYAGGQLVERGALAAWREDFVTSIDIRM